MRDFLIVLIVFGGSIAATIAGIWPTRRTGLNCPPRFPQIHGGILAKSLTYQRKLLILLM
jgi:hypothetical protein